jgi:hypothetical protein
MGFTDRQLQYAYLGIDTVCADCSPGAPQCSQKCTKEEVAFTDSLLTPIEEIRANKHFMAYVEKVKRETSQDKDLYHLMEVAVGTECAKCIAGLQPAHQYPYCTTCDKDFRDGVYHDCREHLVKKDREK